MYTQTHENLKIRTNGKKMKKMRTFLPNSFDWRPSLLSNKHLVEAEIEKTDLIFPISDEEIPDSFSLRISKPRSKCFENSPFQCPISLQYPNRIWSNSTRQFWRKIHFLHFFPHCGPGLLNFYSNKLSLGHERFVWAPWHLILVTKFSFSSLRNKLKTIFHYDEIPQNFEKNCFFHNFMKIWKYPTFSKFFSDEKYHFINDLKSWMFMRILLISREF